MLLALIVLVFIAFGLGLFVGYEFRPTTKPSAPIIMPSSTKAASKAAPPPDGDFETIAKNLSEEFKK